MPDDEDQPPAEQVGELPAGEHQRGERERVARDDPLELERSAPRSRWIEGSATFTTVLSSMIMKSPNATAPSVHHFRGSPDQIEFHRLSSPLVSTRLVALRVRRGPARCSTVSRTVAEVVWTPSPERVERANLTRLQRRLGCETYAELHRVSVEEPERFWPEVVADLGLEFSRPWERVLDVSAGIEWATWFVGGRLNLAWNCVHRWAAASGPTRRRRCSAARTATARAHAGASSPTP